MNDHRIRQLLEEVGDFRQERNLSKKQMARLMGISYNTFKKWFLSGQARRLPSPAFAERIRKFLQLHKGVEARWENLWSKILAWWETQHRYPGVGSLADEIGWDASGLASYLEKKQAPPRLVVEAIAKAAGVEVPAPGLTVREARRRAEKVKHLLLFLEEELRWFRDAVQEARDVFRGDLDSADIGYLSSLMTMLSDEGKFRRWLTLTTNRFNFFRKRRGHK